MMTHDEAITSLLETCENLKEAIEQLLKKNAFLADTIEKNNLEKIETNNVNKPKGPSSEISPDIQKLVESLSDFGNSVKENVSEIVVEEKTRVQDSFDADFVVKKSIHCY